MATTIHVLADNSEDVTGGICFSLYRWHTGWGPEVDWVIDARHDRSSHVNSVEVSCPAMGVTLPATFRFTLPDLDGGTWMLRYDWTRGQGRLPEDRSSAAYVFEVG